VRRFVGILLAATACGRIDYDSIGGDGDGGVIDGDGSIANGDAGVGSDLLAEYLCNVSLADTSGNSFDLSVFSGTEAYTDGVEGGASCAVNASILRTSIIGLNPAAATIEAWVRPGTVGVGRTVAGIGGVFSLGLSSSDRVSCRAQTKSGMLFSFGGVAITAASWFHVACTFNANGSMTIWVNGINSLASQVASELEPIGPLDTDIGDGVFQGDLDAVRIWNHELSAAEVCAAAGGMGC